ncbi:lysozyme inhibitor LprI family protein [Methylocystis sp. 9N]|uniref:Lysozyme inhibitor LprI family protein n=1 Tax=Methylocystis borbori TaxID=3118750 RepID=A0ABU7XES3_9HYPH
MIVGSEIVRRAAVCYCCAAILSGAAGPASAQEDEKATPKDRAAVATCLKLAVEADKKRQAQDTAAREAAVPPKEEKIDAAGWIAALAAKPARINRSSCIGVVSDPCQDVPDNGSTMGLAECARRELRVWEERLNAAYKAWMAKCGGASICAGRRKLERAWLAYRDELCARQEPSGTIAIIEGSECMKSATAEQAIWLEQQIADSNGG